MKRLPITLVALCLTHAAACASHDPIEEATASTETDEETNEQPDERIDAGCEPARTTAEPSSTSNAVEDSGAAIDPHVAAHIAVVRARIAASNAQDWDTWQSLHTEDAVRTAPGLPGPIEGAGAMRDAIEELFVTFPDYHLELEEAFGSGDMLVARIHTRATMQGPLWLGETEVPATGNTFEQDWLAWLRFEGDKIAAIDEFYDNYEVLVQLGLTL